MTTTYDPALVARLIATVRSGLVFGELKPYADQLEASLKLERELIGAATGALMAVQRVAELEARVAELDRELAAARRRNP